MLKCQQIVALADKYLEGEMAFKQCLSYKLHLFMCKDCKNYVKQMKITFDSLNNIANEQIIEQNQASDRAVNKIINKAVEK